MRAVGNIAIRTTVWATVAAGCGTVPAVTADESALAPRETSPPVTSPTSLFTPAATAVAGTPSTAPGSTTVRTTSPITTTTTSATTSTTTSTTSSTTTAPEPARTSCTSVAHIGDSTSYGMDGATGLLEDGEDIATQYGRVGVDELRFLPDPGRSILERLTPAQLNGVEVAQQVVASGFQGCWVIALGTNDAANIAVGANVEAGERVDRLMAVIGDDPVLWVNAATVTTSGPWASANMQAWNVALDDALRGHPNVRVLDWAAVARPEWFQPDGIHHNGPGLAARIRVLADGLLDAFPA